MKKMKTVFFILFISACFINSAMAGGSLYLNVDGDITTTWNSYGSSHHYKCINDRTDKYSKWISNPYLPEACKEEIFSLEDPPYIDGTIEYVEVFIVAEKQTRVPGDPVEIIFGVDNRTSDGWIWIQLLDEEPTAYSVKYEKCGWTNKPWEWEDLTDLQYYIYHCDDDETHKSIVYYTLVYVKYK